MMLKNSEKGSRDFSCTWPWKNPFCSVNGSFCKCYRRDFCLTGDECLLLRISLHLNCLGRAGTTKKLARSLDNPSFIITDFLRGFLLGLSTLAFLVFNLSSVMILKMALAPWLTGKTGIIILICGYFPSCVKNAIPWLWERGTLHYYCAMREQYFTQILGLPLCTQYGMLLRCLLLA